MVDLAAPLLLEIDLAGMDFCLFDFPRPFRLDEGGERDLFLIFAFLAIFISPQFPGNRTHMMALPNITGSINIPAIEIDSTLLLLLQDGQLTALIP